jgi:hypothetical protein
MSQFNYQENSKTCEGLNYDYNTSCSNLYLTVQELEKGTTNVVNEYNFLRTGMSLLTDPVNGLITIVSLREAGEIATGLEGGGMYNSALIKKYTLHFQEGVPAVYVGTHDEKPCLNCVSLSDGTPSYSV